MKNFDFEGIQTLLMAVVELGIAHRDSTRTPMTDFYNILHEAGLTQKFSTEIVNAYRHGYNLAQPEKETSLVTASQMKILRRLYIRGGIARKTVAVTDRLIFLSLENMGMVDRISVDKNTIYKITDLGKAELGVTS